jgi:ACS family tartrate transporter-like MFS transporter
VATPTAQIISPKITNLILPIGTDEIVNGVLVHHPELLGLEGWQWVYILWGVPAVVLGAVVWFVLKDRPADAKWLSTEERAALEDELAREKEKRAAGRKLSVWEALRHPKVLLLAAAYFGCTTANYGVEFFLPSILENWYHLKLNAITWLVLLPPILALCGQLFVGWNSDRTKERRYHAVVPIVIGAVALGLAPLTQGNIALTIACFMVAAAGIKAYQPAFWSLPSLFLTSTAAAGSIGLINSIGNLGGFLGPRVLGYVKTHTGSFAGGVYLLAGGMLITATILFFLGLGHREKAGPAATRADAR